MSFPWGLRNILYCLQLFAIRVFTTTYTHTRITDIFGKLLHLRNLLCVRKTRVCALVPFFALRMVYMREGVDWGSGIQRRSYSVS